jgi:hypothetical protein
VGYILAYRPQLNLSDVSMGLALRDATCRVG